MVEDDPYGELRFDEGGRIPYIGAGKLPGSILLGTFSKTVTPGMRTGFMICADTELLHIAQIRQLYKEQAQAMTEAMDRYFPKTVKYTRPHGGMFLWVTLPEGVSALSLFPKALEKKVAFVPGDPFYINMTNTNTMRLNYTNADCRMIDEGIRRLGELLNEI